MPNYKPVVLVILDGWGEWEQAKGNPIANANLPTFRLLDHYYPKTLLQASGKAVGLPWQVMGNSEVGHQTIGSGQIIYQFLPMITALINSRVFFQNEALLKSINWVKEKKSQLHLLGLLSDGGVHSHLDHLLALLELAKEQNVEKVFTHAILDGRDTPPKSAETYLKKVQEEIKNYGIGQIATIIGRYFAMDRNQHWDRIEKAYLCLTQGSGQKATDPLSALAAQYQNNKIDEYLDPVNIVDAQNKPLGLIKDKDAIIFFNFRKDRARQITQVFIKPDIEPLTQWKHPQDLQFTSFAQYDDDLPTDIAFRAQEITVRVGEIISHAAKMQLRIAETEKFAHVTYFFNGGADEPYSGEERVLVPSKSVETYAQAPEMSTREMTEKILALLGTKPYDFILINFAAPDMVGHTGDFQAAIKAVEIVDECLQKIIDRVLEMKGCLVISADHGNVEEMINTHTGEIDTQHSTNPVPCWFVAPTNKKREPLLGKRSLTVNGMIVDLAPTILELMQITPPPEMIGRSLIPILQWV